MPGSEKQARFMRVVRGIQEGATPASYSPEAAKAAKTMSVKAVRDFARKPKKKKRTLKDAEKAYAKGM